MKTNVAVLALVLGIAGLQSASAQTFKKVKVALNAPLVQVVSGGISVWARASNGNPYIYNGKSFVLANNISLTQIAVGGGNAAQADTVWALNSSGNIFHASKSGSSWTFSQIANGNFFTAVVAGPGYQDACHPYEVWALNSGSQIFRYNFCLGSFDSVPGILCDIHEGGGDVWGPDCGPDVFRFNFSTGSFNPVPSPFAAFPALAVGPGDVVWGIDTSNGDLDQFQPFANAFGFVKCCFTQIQAGGDGVWALSGTNIYRLEPYSIGLVQVPGALTSISVGSGGGVWGINGSNQVFAFSTP